MKNLIVLVGKSSSGKDTIQKELCEKHGFTGLVSTTTRPKRSNEEDGKAYFFKTKEEYEKLLADNEMIESRLYHAKQGDWYYGLSKKAFDIDADNIVVVLELMGLNELKKYLINKPEYNITSFYISASDFVRKERAIQRDSNFNLAEWDRRMVTDALDFSIEKVMRSVDYITSNDNVKLEDITKEIVEIAIK